MVETITSLANLRIKQWIKLKQKKYRSKTQTYLIEGKHLVQEALRYGVLDTLILAKPDPSLVFDGPTIMVNAVIMNALSDTTSQCDCMGVVHFNTIKPWSNHIVVLDHVQDPGNLGTIIRSALSFGFDTILAIDCVDHTNEKVVRSTQGALFAINYQTMENIESTYQQLRESGYTIYATALKHAKPLKDMVFDERCAIVMGNEGNGCSDYAIDAADQTIKIEMATFESLNVAVATSILMYTIYQKSGG